MVARVPGTHTILHVYSVQIPNPLARFGQSLQPSQLSLRILRMLVSHLLGYLRPPEVANNRYSTYLPP